ncbi:hypothetical protein ABFS82_08G198400 [Erythranthe guttata]
MEKTCYCICSTLAYILLLQLFCEIHCLASNSTSTLSIVTDQSALLVLRSRITSDPYRIITKNWTNSSSVCSWIGVTCGSRHNRVIALNISKMGLSADTIPPQLGNLSFLVSLDFSYNFFGGPLSEQQSWLGLLTKLKYLSLRNNSFTGFIPSSLSNLTNLRVLDFSFNYLQGYIPLELGRLHNLQFLAIENNRLSGNIPSAIFNMSTLITIGFTENELSGGLPSDMCSKLPLLRHIHLSENKLRGEIPTSLSECSLLQTVLLSFNTFRGRIPREIGNLKFLRILYLWSNNLNGVIPSEIGNLQNLAILGIEGNQFSGTIPLTIFNISSLQRLLLHHNQLSGNLPKHIGNLTKLKHMEIAYNNLTGRNCDRDGHPRDMEDIFTRGQSDFFPQSLTPRRQRFRLNQVFSILKLCANFVEGNENFKFGGEKTCFFFVLMCFSLHALGFIYFYCFYRFFLGIKKNKIK